MTKTLSEISIEVAEAELDTIIDRVEAGETIVITRDGQPVASIRPLSIYPDRGFGVPDDQAPEA